MDIRDLQGYAIPAFLWVIEHWSIWVAILLAIMQIYIQIKRVKIVNYECDRLKNEIEPVNKEVDDEQRKNSG